MNQRDIAKALAPLSVAFDRELSEMMLEVYLVALVDLTSEQLGTAVSRAIRECDRFPVPAILRKLAGTQDGKSTKDRAMDAWLQVSRAASVYHSVDVHDPVLAATIEAMGGWVQMCSDDRETHWIEKDFVRWYEHFATQRLPKGVTQFAGLHEANNAGRIGGPEPRRIQLGMGQLRALPKPTGDAA